MDQYTGAFKKYAVFSGRATRKEYWMFMLFNLLVSIILSFVFSGENTKFITSIYGIATIVPVLALSARRLHDTGRTAWWLLLNLIPIIGSAVLMSFAVLDSQTGTNIYGSNPKGDTYVAQSAKGLVALVIVLHTVLLIALIAMAFMLLAIFGIVSKDGINKGSVSEINKQIQEKVLSK
jgi:uncharacterized membrane protein YhaH (DUF805 family)